MQANVIELAGRSLVRSTSDIALVDVPHGWKEAIVLWTDLNQRRVPKSPLFLISKIALVTNHSVIASNEQATRGEILFYGNLLNEMQKAIAGTIVGEGISGFPNARVFHLRNGYDIRALALSFSEVSSIDVILFGA